VTNLLTLLPALADCLEAQMEAAGLPPVCFLGVIPGQALIADYSGDCEDVCGMAWVRVATYYPSQTIGAQDITLGNCAAGLGADIEVGILRCMPMDEDPITEEEALEVYRLQFKDAEAARKAIVCCDQLHRRDYILGAYAPMGPLGGMVGGVWRASVGL